MNEPAGKTKDQGPSIVPATLEDLLAIPEEERRHELIEGTIYPTIFHKGPLLALEINSTILQHVGRENHDS